MSQCARCARARTQACSGVRWSCAAPLEDIGAAAGFERNQKLAHSFMICSNIKPTAREESIGLAIRVNHEENQRDSRMDVQRKLEILADAAKYDASCASSGTEKRDSSDGKGLGSTAPGMG